MKKIAKRQTAKKTQIDTPRLVGRVTSKERDEIQALYERKNGLKELVLMLQQNGGVPANQAFYEKLVTDMGKTTTRFQKWWSDKAKTYGWENIAGWQWSIDFDTCEISLNRK